MSRTRWFEGRLPALIVLATLLFTSLAIVSPAVFAGKAILPGDQLYQFEPWATVYGERPVQNHYLADALLVFHPERVFAASELRSGRIPSWNPFMGLGYPALAAQESIWTWALPLYALLDFWPARTLELWGTLVLAGAFALVFLRNLGLPWPPSLFGAMTAMLAFQFTQNLLTGHLVQPLLWLPLMLLCLDRARAKRRFEWLLGASMVAGVGLLAGSLQGMLYVITIVGLDVIWAALVAGREQGWRAGARQFLLEGTVLGLVAMSMSGLRLLPTLELLQLNERSVGASLVTWADAWWRRLAAIPMVAVGAIAPGLLGDHHSLDVTKVLGQLGARGTITGQEFKPYVGVLPLIAAVRAIAGWRESPQVRRFAFLLLATPFLAALTPLGLWLYFPRVLILSVLPLGVLSALGAHALSTDDNVRARKWVRNIVLIAAAWILVGSTISAAIRSSGDALQARGRAIVSAQVSDGANTIERERQLNKVNRLVTALGFPSWAFLAPSVIALLGVALLATARKETRSPFARRAAMCGLYLIASADLADVARGFLPSVDRRDVFPDLPVLQFLKSKAAGARVTVLGGPDRLLFPPNTLAAYGIEDARAYESLLPSQALLRRDSSGSLLAAAYVITPKGYSVAGATLVYDREVRVFLSATARPRIYVKRESPCEDGDLRVTSQTATSLTFEVRLRCDGEIVRVDRAYPGWRASVDGVPEPLVSVNDGLQVVRVPRGTHTATFRFDSVAVTRGAALTLLATLAGLTGIVVIRLRRRQDLAVNA